MTTTNGTRPLPNRTDVELFARKYKVDPDDLFQETTLRVLRSSGPNDPSCDRNWLRVVIKNTAISMLRAEVPETAVDFLEDTLTDDTSPAANACKTERAEFLVAAVRSLKPMDFDVLNDHYCHGKQIKQIAAEYGVPIGTVKRRLHVARKRLAAKLTGFKSFAGCPVHRR